VRIHAFFGRKRGFIDLDALAVDLHLKLTQDLHLKLTHPGRI
jgi:hypothetical protein